MSWLRDRLLFSKMLVLFLSHFFIKSSIKHQNPDERFLVPSTLSEASIDWWGEMSTITSKTEPQDLQCSSACLDLSTWIWLFSPVTLSNGLNENGSRMLRSLNPWSPVGSFVRVILGSETLLEKVHHWRWTSYHSQLALFASCLCFEVWAPSIFLSCSALSLLAWTLHSLQP